MTLPVMISRAELNAPFGITSKSKIKAGDAYVFDESENPLAVEFIEVVPNIFVQKELAEKFNAEYFWTPIAGCDVYASLHLYGGYLPTARNAKFLVLPAGEIPENKDWDYKRVMYTDELNIGGLYRSACSYAYNADADAYLRLPDNGAAQNALKLDMQKHVREIGGDAYDRIADLSRLALFLLSRVELSESEKTLLAPLMAYAAKDAAQLADIAHREKLIQAYIAHVKEDTEAYLNE